MSPVLYSFLQGTKDVRTKRALVGAMYLFRLVVSLVLFSPLYLMLSGSFGRNVKASDLLTRWDLSLVIDFAYFWRRTLSIYFVLFILACGAIVLGYMFLSGGFWGILRDQARKGTQGSTMERFFGHCGRYFWRMFQVTLFLAVLYVMAAILFLSFSGLLDHVLGHASLWEVASWGMVVRFLIGAILFMLVNMTGDYLRIFSIHSDGQRFLKMAGTTFRFLLTNLGRVLSLYYLLSAGLAVVVLAFWGLLEVMNTLPGTGILIILTFGVQQVLVLFRSFFRLVYYSSQLTLHHRISGEGGLEH
jgi:hypothetical protein